jgi:hypothetical protein
MIKFRLFITIAFLLFAACKQVPVKVGTLPIPNNSRIVHVKLIDTLGTVALAVPARYDTFFSWIDYSDCGKPCDEQKYRFQPKNLRITKETGWFWLGEPKDSVERFTISHSGYFPFHNGDTAKNLIQHNYLKAELKSDPSNPPIVFDTIEKINDRYYSIIAMEKTDTVQSKKVLAATTIRGNLIKFQYDLLTKKDDSIERNFLKNSIDLIRTIHITDTSPKQNLQPKSKTYEQGPIYSDSSIQFYTKGNNKYIIIDTIRFQIPVDVNITPANIYDGIYELKSDSLVKHKFLITKKLIFLTTFEDLGMGIRSNLYAFDMVHKRLIRDSSFDRSYLHSSAGIFIIESDRIFSIDKSGYYQKKHEFIIPAGLYLVKEQYFENIKDVYKVGEEIPGDTSSMIPFFKSSISPHSKGALLLPDDWWKVDENF